MFLTTELWQTFAEMPQASLSAVAVVISIVVLLFIGGQIPGEVSSIEEAVAARRRRLPHAYAACSA